MPWWGWYLAGCATPPVLFVAVIELLRALSEPYVSDFEPQPKARK